MLHRAGNPQSEFVDKLDAGLARVGEHLGAATHGIREAVAGGLHFDAIHVRLAVAHRFAGTGIVAHVGHHGVDLLDMFDAAHAVQTHDDGIGVGTAADQAETDHGHAGVLSSVTEAPMLASAAHAESDADRADGPDWRDIMASR